MTLNEIMKDIEADVIATSIDPITIQARYAGRLEALIDMIDIDGVDTVIEFYEWRKNNRR